MHLGEAIVVAMFLLVVSLIVATKLTVLYGVVIAFSCTQVKLIFYRPFVACTFASLSLYD